VTVLPAQSWRFHLTYTTSHFAKPKGKWKATELKNKFEKKKNDNPVIVIQSEAQQRKKNPFKKK